jgi:hypothetical protein
MIVDAVGSHLWTRVRLPASPPKNMKNIERQLEPIEVPKRWTSVRIDISPNGFDPDDWFKFVETFGTGFFLREEGESLVVKGFNPLQPIDLHRLIEPYQAQGALMGVTFY